MLLKKVINYLNRHLKKLYIGIYALGDQGFFSLTNFFVNIILARSVEIKYYGTFTTLFSIFLFFAGIQNALILEPMSVIGPTKQKAEWNEYLKRNFSFNIVISTFISLCFFLISFFYNKNIIEIPLVFILFSFSNITFWFFRRINYIKLDPKHSFWGSIIYFSTTLTGTFIIKHYMLISVVNIILLLVICGVMGSLYIWKYYHLLVNTKIILDAKRVFQEHWEYSKWVLGSVFVFWLSGTVYIPMTATMINAETAGILKAYQNLLLPFSQVSTSLSLLFLPYIAKKINIYGNNWLKKGVFQAMLIFFSLAIFYSFFLTNFSFTIVSLLYKQDIFLNYLWTIPYWLLTLFLGTANQVLGIFLKSLKMPRIVFQSQLSGSLFTLTIGIYLISKYKLLGVLISMNLVLFIMLLVQSLNFFRLKNIKQI